MITTVVLKFRLLRNELMIIYDTIVEKIVSFIAKVEKTFASQDWLSIIAVLIVLFVLERIFIFILTKANLFAKKTKTDLDDRVIHKITRPISIYIMLSGLFILGQIIKFPTGLIDVEKLFVKIIEVSFALNTIWIAFRVTDVVGDHFIHKVIKTSSHLDDQLIPIFQKTVKTFVVLVGAIYVIQSLGYSISGLVAGLGIGGLAVAMASKDALANLFGSIIIFTDRPFKIGDWVMVGSEEGTIEEIGFRSTKIRTFAKTLITIPNATVANSAVNNFSRMPKRRVKFFVGVTYDTSADQMERLVENIRKLLREEKGVDQSFFLVNFTEFGASSLDIMMYYFTVTTDWAAHLDLRQKVNLSVMRLIEESGLSIAFPTQTVHIESDLNLTEKR